MAILYDQKQKLFTLLTEHTMYQMKVDDCQVLLHTYYGKRTQVCDYSYRITYADHGFSGVPYEKGNHRGYSLDILPQEYPSYGGGDYRESALKLRFTNGAQACELRYAGYEILPGKYQIPGLPAVYDTEPGADQEGKAADGLNAETLAVYLKDQTGQVQVRLLYGVLEELDMITRAAEIKNIGTEPLFLERAFSMSMDFQHMDLEAVSFHGRHAKERTLQRKPVDYGTQVYGSTRGASSHQMNPFLILCSPDAEEERGYCYGFSFLYSGNFYGAVQKDQMDSVRAVLGIHPDDFCWKLMPEESFHTPEAAMVFSEKGFGTLSRRYHKAYRHHLCRGRWKTARRPILLNSWEGVYFDFNGEKLAAMAKEAADLGVELFVMDDGWFGKRDDDNSGLGDWIVNEKKLGCSLGELSRQIHGFGMKFGIWFEPECVSEDSDLYRAHPDWAVKVPGKPPVRSRNQLILDFSRKEVRTFIFEEMCQVLDGAQIDYVKWDFNRSISDWYSAARPADRQGETAHRYILGLYEVLEALRKRYPDLLIEGCSGGGGRFDAGMLYYTPQIWCSDDTDAVERLSIQYGTSFGYPISTMGAHVSKCPNEQTGRYTPFETRAVTAMAGTFGYELDVNKMTEEDKKAVREQIGRFKEHYRLIQDGEYYRLTDPENNKGFHAWEFVSEDKTEALICGVALKSLPNGPGYLVFPKGLDAGKQYRIHDQILPGDALMEAGIPVPEIREEYGSAWIYFQAV